MLAALAERAEAARDPARRSRWTRARIEHEPLGEAAHRDLIRLLAIAATVRRRSPPPTRSPSACGASCAFRPARRRARWSRRCGADGVGATAPATQLPLPAPLARTARPEGREAPLARLKAAWDDAATGTLRIAVATGEPGIGKTTLLGEFARRVHAAGRRGPVRAQRRAGPAPVPAVGRGARAPPRRAAAGRARAPRSATARSRACCRSLSAVPSGDAAGERYRAFEAVRTLLEETAAERPVLLVLDDLHWADPDSLQLLRHLARMAHGARVLIAISDAPGGADDGRRGDARRPAPRRPARPARADRPRRGRGRGRARPPRRRPATPPPTASAPAATRSSSTSCCASEAVGDADGAAARRARGDRPPHRAPARAGPLRLQAGAALGMEFEPLVLTTAERVVDGLAAAVARRAAGAGRRAPLHVPARADRARPCWRRCRPRASACMHLRIADVLGEQGGHAGEIAKHVRAAGTCAPAERRVAAELAAARQAEAALAYADAAGHYEAALAAGAPRGRGAASARADGGRRARRGRAGDATWPPATPPTARRAEILLALGAAHDRAGTAPPRRPRSARSSSSRAPPRPAAARSRGARSRRRRRARGRHRPRDHAPARGGAGAAARPRARRSPRGCGRGSRSSSTTPTTTGRRR